MFSALKAGTLSSVQICIHPDPQDRSKVVECYTFTVEYLTRADGSEIPTGLRMDSPKDSLALVAATSSALQKLLVDVVNLCQKLPKLPGQSVPVLHSQQAGFITFTLLILPDLDAKFASMEVFFRDDVPSPSIPKGWIPGSSDDLKFGECEGWVKQTETLEQLQSGFHR